MRLDAPVWMAGGPPPQLLASCEACGKLWLVYVCLPFGLILVDMSAKPMDMPTGEFVEKELREATAPQSLHTSGLN